MIIAYRHLASKKETSLKDEKAKKEPYPVYINQWEAVKTEACELGPGLYLNSVFLNCIKPDSQVALN